jgi:hypothetical protein
MLIDTMQPTEVYSRDNSQCVKSDTAQPAFGKIEPAGGFHVKSLFVTLILCSAALAKDRSGAKYEDAIFQETHTEPVRMNCFAAGYNTSMSTCHDAEMLVYTVDVGASVYTLTPYGTLPHHESLWRQPAGAAVAVWNDGKHVHVRTGAKESQYDIIGASTEDATR